MLEEEEDPNKLENEGVLEAEDEEEAPNGEEAKAKDGVAKFEEDEPKKVEGIDEVVEAAPEPEDPEENTEPELDPNTEEAPN